MMKGENLHDWMFLKKKKDFLFLTYYTSERMSNWNIIMCLSDERHIMLTKNYQIKKGDITKFYFLRLKKICGCMNLAFSCQLFTFLSV